MLPCCITVECHTMKMYQPPQTPANMFSLTGIRMSLDQVKKYIYPCLTAFILTDHWLKHPNIVTSHIAFECQKWRCSNYHKTFAKIPTLTGVGVSLVHIKHTYPCLTAFIMTEHWLKQPKLLPSHIVVECQNWRCSNHLKTPAYKPSLTNVGMSLVQIKHNLSMFNIFYYDWTLAEAAKNAAQPHCCWVPKMKVLQPPQNSCK